jgi:hypothetical protein
MRARPDCVNEEESLEKEQIVGILGKYTVRSGEDYLMSDSTQAFLGSVSSTA